ncbi:PRKC apoptosis WT1 regulator protein [Ambystoma mexicanum]|uniref:PRKC apoptosis WT1 regulator protein n=1 Tax=Ambystoma mexicanum TaxID=8296 RepID=UPI0037E8C995
MATGGYRAPPATSTTTDFLEEWKAKREKMRARLYGEVPGSVLSGTGGGTGSNEGSIKPAMMFVSNELNNNNSSHPAAMPDRPIAANCMTAPTTTSFLVKSSSSSSLRKSEEEQPPLLGVAPSASSLIPGGRVAPETALKKAQEKLSPADQQSQEDLLVGLGAVDDTCKDTPAKAKDKAKISGPSARKGKGQIEKRKMREKRRSTGVVNIPSLESPDEYEDDESGQKERKKADTVTQQNTVQNESYNIDPSEFHLQQETSRTVSSRNKSTTNAPDDDASSRYSKSERMGYNRHNRDTNFPGNSAQSSAMEKKIEELEKELAKERQENVRLVKIMQDKEEIIEKMKEEIDLLNRDLDDIEDENEQLKQENKTLLKVVGQLTR